MGSGGSWSPKDLLEDAAKSGLKSGMESVSEPIEGLKKAGQAISGTTPDNSDISGAAPSYSIDTEAAKRRNRALALRRGFTSTQRATGGADSASILAPTLSGKTKLGQ